MLLVQSKKVYLMLLLVQSKKLLMLVPMHNYQNPFINQNSITSINLPKVLTKNS